MEGPRAPEIHEWTRVVEFLNTHLRPGQGWSIADEYPTAITSSNRINSRVIFDGDQIISHAIVRPIIVKNPIGVFKVAGIGSVVTSDQYRKQGLSTQILESCLQAARDSNCDLAILWTDLFDFYRRIGFELAGSEVSFEIDRDLVSNTQLRFVEGPKVDPAAVLRLYAQHTVTSHRSIDDIRESLAIPNSRVTTAWDSMGRMVAYAVEGKGADLNGYIHEWGGSLPNLLALFTHMRTTQKRTLRLITPAHSLNLIAKLTELGLPVHRGHLGMMKLLKPDSFFSKIQRHARSLGIADLVLEKKDGKFYFGRGLHVYSTDSEADILRLLFGPTRPSELHAFDRTTAETFDRLLPVPMWIWGWDSV